MAGERGREGGEEMVPGRGGGRKVGYTRRQAHQGQAERMRCGKCCEPRRQQRLPKPQTTAHSATGPVRAKSSVAWGEEMAVEDAAMPGIV